MAEPLRGGRGGVVVCEPQFRGSTHATFNAGLLAAAARAFPETPLIFAAHPSHSPWVREALPSDEPATAATVAELPELPSLRRRGRLRRTAAELRVWLGVLARARRRGARLVLFTSMTKLGALLLQLGVRAGSPPVIAVVHQLFELERPDVGKLPSMATLLALPPPRRLVFAAPASAVGEALARRRPRLAQRFVTLEPACFWRRHEPPAPPVPGAVRFGLFGRANAARLGALLALARRVGAATGAAFRVVGFVPEDLPLAGADAELLGHPARRPLPVGELSRLAEAVDFALWLGGEDYELRLSASFLDALSHLRPLVALRTPFAEHYFRELGEIGALCGGQDELAATVAALATAPSAERHRAWSERMIAGRRRFEPAAVAASLRAVADHRLSLR